MKVTCIPLNFNFQLISGRRKRNGSVSEWFETLKRKRDELENMDLFKKDYRRLASEDMDYPLQYDDMYH